MRSRLARTGHELRTIPAPGAVTEPGQPPGDDAVLAGRAAAGDVPAFETLYRRHHRRIYGLCLRFTGDAPQAEEHTQETFVKAWEHLPAFRGDSAFSTWLHRIATNVVLGAFRSRRRLGRHLKAVDDDELAALPAIERPVGPQLDLERAIASLPPGARTVFVLHDVEGWQHDEIAAQTGLAVGTSKAQLHRARRLLRERLTP
jgi:RNA polymerase sigma-70 factor (ECF subfamily)